MKAYIFNFITATLVALIVYCLTLILNKNGIFISKTTACVNTSLAFILSFVLLIPSVAKKLKYALTELDWAEETVRLYKSVPFKYRQSFWLIFGFINLAFLFHTINFMWGNKDWAAVRFAVNPDESLQAGSFSAYWLQELLFEGKILPVANNLLAFAGLSLAGVLLAIYWNLPRRASVIVITALLFAITPYTLSVLYHARTSLGVLFLPALTLTALILSEYRPQSHTYAYLANLLCIFLFLVSLGTSFLVINFISTAFFGRVLLKTVYADISLKSAFSRIRQGVSNFSAAAMIYLLILFALKETGLLSQEHALALNPIAPFFKVTALFKYAFWQFAMPLPFMDSVYRFLNLAFVIFALLTMIYKAPNASAAARGLLLVPAIVILSFSSLLFDAAPLQNMSQAGFFSLPLILALSYAVLVQLSAPKPKHVALSLAVLLIFMNFVRVAYAQKVWKFGWEAETKLSERIITRLEKQPEFDITKQYTLLQIGEKSLRHKYYIKKSEELNSPELIAAAYYPANGAADAYNFFYQTDFLKGDDKGEALNIPAIRDYLLNTARPYPAKESLFISGDYIILVLDEIALERLKNRLR
ncbi:MAG: hypothetical protein J6J35_08265 [Alphaproteobacteria bacterium]|nr:hypothetical protein [Alphaproteobacteria bacterium]